VQKFNRDFDLIRDMIAQRDGFPESQ